MRPRDAFFPAEPKTDSFLTALAVHGTVAAATQNQAMNALVFFSKRVLTHALPGRINAVRADKKRTAPVVMTSGEVAAALSRMHGTAQPVAKLLYGNGLHIMKAVRLRVKAIKVAVLRAGLPKPISAHSVRHAFATRLLQCGTDIRTIQPLLGHHDVATTLIDSHILPQGGQGVPSLLDGLSV